MVISIIFFETAIELIPESLRNHPLIRKEWKTNTRKKNRGILLDNAIHASLMKDLPSREKRGRPDIIYYSLLNLLYSPLISDNKVKIIIHTYNNRCIHIPSDWRIPVNYNRFVGLFSQLLYKKRIPIEGKSLLTVDNCTMNQILENFSQNRIFLLERLTETSNEFFKFNTKVDDDSVFLIGGFQSGESSFLLNAELPTNLDFQQISLYEETKPAWIIASRIIHNLEDQLL